MPLTKRQMTTLATALDKRHATLLAEVRSELEHSENQQYVELIDREHGDIGDQSVADTLADMNLVIVDRHILELRELEAAKARIKDATFGTCIDCEGSIPVERLAVYPAALRCITCQQQKERLYAHAPQPTL